MFFILRGQKNQEDALKLNRIRNYGKKMNFCRTANLSANDMYCSLTIFISED
jgi:hypothetical protein